jgi:hypothetical protein
MSGIGVRSRKRTDENGTMPCVLGGLPYTSSPSFRHSDEKLEPINGYRRVNCDFASKERLLVLYYFVSQRCRHVREAKGELEEGPGHMNGGLCCQWVFQYCCNLITVVPWQSSKLRAKVWHTVL